MVDNFLYLQAVRDSPKITRIGPGNDQATKTVLGVICGVVAGGLLVVLVIYLYGRPDKCE